jgi:hypothetical protein
MRTIMSDSPTFPWDGLTKPSTESLFSSVKVDLFYQWGAYWVLDVQGRCGYLIQFDESVELTRKLPKLRELSVTFRTDDSGKRFLLFVLVQATLKRVFYEFCRGLLNDLESSQDQDEVARRAAEYTWSWYRFLRGRRAELSDEEQRGLIGELVFLKDYLAPHLGWHQSVAAWSGPLGVPKDFSWNDRAVEVKTHMISARPELRISSEFQLDVEGFNSVWLFVVGFQKGDAATPGGVSVSEVFRQARELITSNAPEMVDEFESRVFAYGFHPEHDYSESQWLLGARQAFRVTADFPAIRSASLPPGITQTRYLLALSTIDSFAVGIETIFNE